MQSRLTPRFMERQGSARFAVGMLRRRKDFCSLLRYLRRLFLKKLPTDRKFAVEIRNKDWLVPKLAEVLREHDIALALVDQSWMPRPTEWFNGLDPITADFTYVR